MINTNTTTSRRVFIKRSATALAACSLPLSLQGASMPGIVQLEGSLALINDVGCNVLALLTDSGVVLVDSGRAEKQSNLKSHIAALSKKGASTLFNTHWHEDQTGNNLFLGKTGTTIIAHKKTQLHLGTTYYLPHEQRYKQALPEAALPGKTIYTSDSLTVGQEQIDYGYLPQAHTDGDIYVFFRHANVLAVGDVASPEADPALDWYGGGWLGGRRDAMDQLLAMANDDTRIVPAYGPVMSKAQLKAERDMMAFLYDKTVELVRDGKGPEHILADGVMANLPRQFADPYKFLYDTCKGLWAHHNKLAPNIV